MFAINDLTRFIIGIIVGIDTILLLSILGDLLGPNLKHLARSLIPGEAKGGKPPTRKPRTTWGLFVVVLFIAIIGAAFIQAAPRKEDQIQQIKQMTGEFRVAIAEFTVNEAGLGPNLGLDIADGIYQRLQKSIQENNLDIQINLWGPEQTGAVNGSDQLDIADNAALLAKDIRAHILVYGEIEKVNGIVQINPEFIVNTSNSYEAEEITGQHDLGNPIQVDDTGDFVDLVAINIKLSARVNALAHMIFGLANYSLREYDRALRIFQQAEEIDNWQVGEGQEVLYLFMGNTESRKNDPTHQNLELAEQYYQRAVDIQPDYARGMLGLANIYYRKALLPIEQANNPASLDTELINQALNLLDKAIHSPNQPFLSDVSVKYHFELGQNYLMLAYAGQQGTYDQAVAEFNQVIDAYRGGENPRIKERAAEAHARLGLIHSLSGDNSAAINEYQTALQMTEDPQRKQIFRDRIDQLGG